MKYIFAALADKIKDDDEVAVATLICLTIFGIVFLIVGCIIVCQVI